MNYRHGFHAGNFADVFKHAVLARILLHLGEKPQPYRVIDTHAGAGSYDLQGAQAARTAEWHDGIGRLMQALAQNAIGAEPKALLAPYLAAIAAQNRGPAAEPGAAPRFYPGSPRLALALMRPQDRLAACELEPKAFAALSASLRDDKRGKPFELDGWLALNAQLPPPERRGLVVVDPPFEAIDEFDKLLDGLALALRKWASGSYLLWYPVKGSGASAFIRNLRRAAPPKTLRVELHVRPAEAGRFTGSGLILVNPPWRLAGELEILMPALAAVLAGGRTGRSLIEPLAHKI
jgi:23S rRNA (adenine2030-N6)-methyltransferase